MNKLAQAYRHSQVSDKGKYFSHSSSGIQIEPYLKPQFLSSKNPMSRHLSSSLEIIKPSQAGYLGFSSKKIPYNPDKFLFVHATALLSAPIDQYGVSPGYEFAINANFDVVPNAILASGIKENNIAKQFGANPDGFRFADTFLTSAVFFEHIHQLPLGRVLDYFLYPVTINGLPVLICDCLMAIDQSSPNLMSVILDGTCRYVSQGSYSDALRCSKCGHKAHSTSKDDLCQCLQKNNGDYYTAPDGNYRCTANILGDPNRKDSYAQFDVSVVLSPAIRVAMIQKVLNHNIEDLTKKYSAQPIDLLRSLSSASPLFAFQSSYDMEEILRDILTHPSETFADFSSPYIQKDPNLFAASMIPLSKLFFTMKSLQQALNPQISFQEDLRYKKHLAVSAARKISSTSSSRILAPMSDSLFSTLSTKELESLI